MEEFGTGSSEKRRLGGQGEALTASLIGSPICGRQISVTPEGTDRPWGEITQLSQVFTVRATQRQAAAREGKTGEGRGDHPSQE